MADVFRRNVHCLLGLPFDAVGMADAVREIRDAALRREPYCFSTPNVNWLVASLTDDDFRGSVIRCDLSIADGTPIVWIARLLGIPIHGRVAGSGVFESLRREGAARLSVYFFGGLEGVAETACNRLNADSGGLHCVGFECPGFGTVEELSSEESLARINASGADFVVVALGAKKGQAWIQRNRPRLSAPVISHLGAVIDFAAGRIRRAPVWMQRAGLEWLWRIKEEPGLWRRYFSDGLVFLRLLVTRVAPLAWFRLWHKPTRQELESAGFDLRDEGREIVIRLRGAWVQDNLGPLRHCFSEAAQTGKNITLEMGEVTYVDSAFIGLLMLLHGEQTQHCRRVAIDNLNTSIKRTFRYACAGFLLET